MSTDDYGRAIYLILLLCVVGGYFIVENRGRLGKSAQQALIWGLIFVGIIAGYGLWSDIRRDVLPRQSVLEGGRIELPQARDGHYYATLLVNGVQVNFVIDTGASDIVLAREDAEKVGINTAELTYVGQAATANGIVRTARVTLDDMRLEEITDTDVRAVVNDGEMEGSLLGMAYLNRFTRMEIAGDRMILTR